MNEKWDKRFLGLAELVSTWSLDPSTKVGAVIVDQDKRIVSMGYNGFPQGIEDSKERLENREEKLKIIVHGEINALIFAKRCINGCTLYTHPFMPCGPCCSVFIQAGISRIVSRINTNPRWLKDFDVTFSLCQEAGVQLDLY